MQNHSTSIVYKSLDFLGFEMYRIGEDGSFWKRNEKGVWETRRTRSAHKGHLQVVLQFRGIRKTHTLAKLVLMCFDRLPNDGEEVEHIDENVRNNCLSNLRWRNRVGTRMPEKSKSRDKRQWRISIDRFASSVPTERKSGRYHQDLLVKKNGDVEVWRNVRGFEKSYEISNWGRLKSKSRTRPHMGGVYTIPARIIRASICQKKYHKTVDLYFNGKCRSISVHRLVLENFVGDCPDPDRMECCHNDGNPANNRLDNLRWDTFRHNQLDREKHGTSGRKVVGLS